MTAQDGSHQGEAAQETGEGEAREGERGAHFHRRSRGATAPEKTDAQCRLAWQARKDGVIAASRSPEEAEVAKMRPQECRRQCGESSDGTLTQEPPDLRVVHPGPEVGEATSRILWRAHVTDRLGNVARREMGTANSLVW